MLLCTEGKSELSAVDLESRFGRGHPAAIERRHALSAKVGQADDGRLAPVDMRGKGLAQRGEGIGADVHGRHIGLAAGLVEGLHDLRAESHRVDEKVEFFVFQCLGRPGDAEVDASIFQP